MSKTKPTLPKFFDLPPSAVWPDRHWVYIENTSNRPRRGTVHRAIPSCQLIETFLPMTENEAQSYCFALKKLTFDDQLPNRPKGASKLPSFHASHVVRTHLAVYRGSKSTSFFCLFVSEEAHVVSIGAQGRRPSSGHNMQSAKQATRAGLLEEGHLGRLRAYRKDRGNGEL